MKKYKLAKEWKSHVIDGNITRLEDEIWRLKKGIEVISPMCNYKRDVAQFKYDIKVNERLINILKINEKLNIDYDEEND